MKIPIYKSFLNEFELLKIPVQYYSKTFIAIVGLYLIFGTFLVVFPVLFVLIFVVLLTSKDKKLLDVYFTNLMNYDFYF